MSQVLRPLLLAAAFILAACGSSVSIKEVIDNPRKYDGQTVTLRGEVEDSFALFGLRYYTLKDATGSIRVTTERPLPNKGERVTATGKVKEAFAIGSQRVTVLVEEAPKK